jgi:hypothetical protein
MGNLSWRHSGNAKAALAIKKGAQWTPDNAQTDLIKPREEDQISQI